VPKIAMAFLFTFSGGMFAGAASMAAGLLPSRGPGVLDGIGAGCLAAALTVLAVERLIDRKLPEKVDALAQDRALRYLAEAVAASQRAAARVTRPFHVVRAR
jgi:hypothetical protein